MTGGQKLLWMAIGGGVVLVLALVGCGIAGVIAASVGATTSSTVAAGPAVAIVRVEGVIVSGRPASTNPFGGGSTSSAYSSVIVDHLRRAEADSSVKVVILRVDSPGGSVVASQEIHQQMLAMTKPVIVSMGETAASGGYYVSAPAKEIFANPATLTGSIGVISEFINVGDLLNQYGVKVTVVKSGAFKDEGSAFRPMTEEEVAVWQAIIDEAYQGFVQVVADGRKLPVDQVKKLADGRVYTGRQAQSLGLVDKLGNLPDVVKRAAELGGIQGEPRIVEYKEPLTLFGSLFNLSRPSDPVGDVMALLDRGHGPALQYLYVGP